MYRNKHNESLVTLLQQSAKQHANDTALRDEKGIITYQELAQRIDALASVFIEQGLQVGDRVGFVLPNSIDYVTVHYAVMRAGGVSVPIDNFIMPRNLSFQLKDTEAKFFLFHGEHWDKVSQTDLPDLDFVASTNLPSDESKNKFDQKVFILADIFKKPAANQLPNITSDNRAIFLYTTGTTGRQKGVMLTHRNLVVSAMNIMETCDVTPADCELTALPQTRLFGLAHIHGYLSLGARMMLVRNLILPQKVLPLIEEIGVTSFPHVPTAFYSLMDNYPGLLKKYCSQLRYILMCSAPCKEDRYKQLKAVLPDVRIFTSYGLTEAARSTIIELDKHPDKLASVGQSTFGMQISVLDDDKVQPPNQEGEVILQGDIVTSGYWKLPEENKRVFCEHGFRTGDLGKLDDDGFLYIVGRIKDIINVSGLKVNPMEIEEVLKGFPGIEDVAVAGFPDEKGSLNEKIIAFYITEDGKEKDIKELRDFCYQDLEKFKVPLHFKLIKEIPKTITGKVQRVKLREAYSF